MASVFDYLDWRGDLSFKADPFNVVDNIIFSILSYYQLDGIVGDGLKNNCVPLPQALKTLEAAMKKDISIERGFVFGGKQKRFLARIAETPRYEDCLLCEYVNKFDVEREMQFAAVTIRSSGALPYISFRGTDKAIIGWKEDFNMILNDAIPAQLEAVSYLNAAAKKIGGKLNIGGHSKGGNLAVYAASFCDSPVQKRINTVYSNDAPGFDKKIVSSGQYKNIEKKIERYIPQGSVVGLLFECAGNYKIVKSSETGLMQHDPFSWELLGKNMIHNDSISKRSRLVNETLTEWLESMDLPTRAAFIETLFTIIDEADIKSLQDFTDNSLKNTFMLIKSLHNTDRESKKMLAKILSTLFKTTGENIHRLHRLHIGKNSVQKSKSAGRL
jgi:hypothetical protein